MPGINVRPAAAEIYWKYRKESIQTKRLGTLLNQPNVDSDGLISGIQNEGLVDVTFIPAAEKIDLYYRPLNERGRGPLVDIVPTSLQFTTNSAIATKRSAGVFVRGDAPDLDSVRVGDMLRIDDEIVTVASISRPDSATLHDELVAFWSLSEMAGVRQNVYGRYALESYNTAVYAAVLGGVTVGPQAGVNAAAFNGNQALSAAYASGLSVAGTHVTGLTISCWTYLTSKSSSQSMVSRWGRADAGRREFLIYYDSGIDRFCFALQNSDGTSTNIGAASAPVINRWYHLCCWYDPTTNRVNMSVDNANIRSLARPVGVESPHSSIETLVGARLIEVSSSDIVLTTALSGRIANVGFWRRALSAAEQLELYNIYAIETEPRGVYVAFEDRGAHGTEAAPHDTDAVVVRMRSTVPTNDIIMDTLSDSDVPSAPPSLQCYVSNDAAEIGFEIVVVPPEDNRKTLRRIQVQASTILWPANIEHTTGIRTILSGPHIGTIRQGEKQLTTNVDLSGINAPYFLYTYDSLDVGSGRVVAGAAYTIESIAGNAINIVENFNAAQESLEMRLRLSLSLHVVG